MALLAAAVASPNIRINDTNERIDRLEARVDRLEARMEARFDQLEAAVADIDRKLTALIAHLNATSEVDDALSGRLADEIAPDAAGTGDDELGHGVPSGYTPRAVMGRTVVPSDRS